MPRTRPSPLARLLGVLALLVHLFGVGAVPLADARAERAAATVVAHVEAPGSKQCPPAHDHVMCTLCRHLGHATSDLAPALAFLAALPVARPEAAPADVWGRPTAALRRTDGARAPPPVLG